MALKVQPLKHGEILKRALDALETYPTRSVAAAAKMASETGQGTARSRLAYSQTLIEESKSLGHYIVEKRSSVKIKNVG